MGQFRALLREDVPRARQALRKPMSGPIRLTPAEQNTYRFEGDMTIGPLIDPSFINMASPRELDLIPQLYASSHVFVL